MRRPDLPTDTRRRRSQFRCRQIESERLIDVTLRGLRLRSQLTLSALTQSSTAYDPGGDGHAVIIASKPFQKKCASVRASARNSSSRPVLVTK